MARALLLRLVAAACCIATAGATTAGAATAGSTDALPDLAASPYRLQMPGDFHGDEPVARDGQRWLALRVDAEGRARLQPTRLQVMPITDPVLDGPDQTSGRRVQAEGAESLAFLRGPTLRSGPVDTAHVQSLGLPGLPDARIEFAGQDYRLQTECAPFVPAPDAFPEMRLSPHCRVLLYRDQAHAVLMEVPATRIRSDDGTEHTSFGNDASPSLLFAGDLDHDGQLDLLLDVTDHYNLQLPTLFLSGAASPAAPTPGTPTPDMPTPEMPTPGRTPQEPSPAAGSPSSPSATGSEPPAPTAADALPLRAVAAYRSVGC